MARAARNTENRQVAPRTTTAVARHGDNVFTSTAAALGSDGGGVIFGKFNGNNGDFTYGTNPAKELEPGTAVLVDMQQAVKRGWICWKDGEVKDERMVLITQGNPPREDELKDHGPYTKKDDGWKEQVSIRFKLFETGEEIELKMTSRAGIRGVGALCKAYGAEFRDHEPDALIVVVLDSKGYTPKDKSYGRKYAPIFEIDEFISPDEAAERLGLPAGGDAAAEDDGEDNGAPWEQQEGGDGAVQDEGEIPTLAEDAEDDDADQKDAPPVRQEAPQVSDRRSRAAGGRRSKRV